MEIRRKSIGMISCKQKKILILHPDWYFRYICRLNKTKMWMWSQRRKEENLRKCFFYLENPQHMLTQTHTHTSSQFNSYFSCIKESNEEEGKLTREHYRKEREIVGWYWNGREKNNRNHPWWWHNTKYNVYLYESLNIYLFSSLSLTRYIYNRTVMTADAATLPSQSDNNNGLCQYCVMCVYMYVCLTGTIC